MLLRGQIYVGVNDNGPVRPVQGRVQLLQRIHVDGAGEQPVDGQRVQFGAQLRPVQLHIVQPQPFHRLHKQGQIVHIGGRAGFLGGRGALQPV